MLGRVGDEEQEVPLIGIEIEVGTSEEPSPIDEVQEPRREMKMYSIKRGISSRPRPHLPMMLARFQTSKNFGLWLIDVMDDKSLGCLQTLLRRYESNPNSAMIRKLGGFGKIAFQGIYQLYYFEGLFIIAVSLKHKSFIKRVYSQQLKKFLQNE